MRRHKLTVIEHQLSRFLGRLNIEANRVCTMPGKLVVLLRYEGQVLYPLVGDLLPNLFGLKDGGRNGDSFK